MDKYFLHGNFTAKPGKEKELIRILLRAAKLLEKAKGCKFYIISIDPQVKENIWVTEVWDSKMDHDNSLNNPKVRELVLQATPFLYGTPEKGQELVTLAGLGFK